MTSFGVGTRRRMAALLMLLSPCLASATQYARVAIVAQAGGDYTTPWDAMGSRDAWCPLPSAANPCLIKIMPGRYDMGSTHLLPLLSYIDVEGSGPDATIIAGSGTPGLYPPVYFAQNATNAELRSLTVEGHGTQAVGVGLSQSVSIKDVVVTNSSSTSPGAVMISLNAGQTAALDHVKVISTSAAGGTNYGIWIEGGSVTITDSSVTATGGYSAWAIYNEFGSVTIRNTTALASGGTSPSVAGSAALLNNDTAVVTNSQFTVQGGSNATAVVNNIPGASLKVDGCQLIALDAGYTVWGGGYFGATRFDGTHPYAGGGTLKCASSYNGSYVATDANCQW